MHFSAKRGIAIACRSSVCLSVCNVGEMQDRLHHLNDGKSKGEGFCSLFQEIKGEAKISLLIVALISSAKFSLFCGILYTASG